MQAPDLRAAYDAALACGFAVAFVEQPYRVAGRRSASRAPRLDEAWRAVCAALAADGELASLAQITGGRSSGPRVAWRTAAQTGARAVLCLAFPLSPPPRCDGTPAPSRLPELAAVEAPPARGAGRERSLRDTARRPGPRGVVDGGHAMRRDLPAVGSAVGAWLRSLLRTGALRRTRHTFHPQR